MKNIVYLFGTGATQAQIDLYGFDIDITMRGISNNVLKMSEESTRL